MNEANDIVYLFRGSIKWFYRRKNKAIERRQKKIKQNIRRKEWSRSQVQSDWRVYANKKNVPSNIGCLARLKITKLKVSE